MGSYAMGAKRGWTDGGGNLLRSEPEQMPLGTDEIEEGDRRGSNGG